MNTYIVTWSGGCQIEADTIEEAIDIVKKNESLMMATFSKFQAFSTTAIKSGGSQK